MYINDLPKCLQYCDVILYEDDSVIYCTESTPLEMQFKINDDLQKMVLWLNKNKLTLNIYLNQNLSYLEILSKLLPSQTWP